MYRYSHCRCSRCQCAELVCAGLDASETGDPDAGKRLMEPGEFVRPARLGAADAGTAGLDAQLVRLLYGIFGHAE
jgi:hypothetical protein